MAQRGNSFTTSLKSTLERHGTFFTLFAVGAIVVGGLVTVSNPSQWWIALLSVTALFVTVFLFMNAKAFIKGVISTLLTFVLASIGFTIGWQTEPDTVGSFVWFFGHFILYFLALAFSYLLVSSRSRWTTLSLSQIVYFVLVWLIATATNSLILSASLSVVFAFGFFLFLYLFSPGSRVSWKEMPQAYEGISLEERIKAGAELAGYGFYKQEDKERGTTYLLWKERAYVLYPVSLDAPFGLKGRRRQQLAYKDKPINAWLRALSFAKTPHFKARGADPMLVLLDMENRNGASSQVIGVSLPDTLAVLPVGVMPSRVLKKNDSKSVAGFLNTLDSLYEEYALDLSEKQKDAFRKFGIEETEEPQKKENLTDEA